MTDRYHVVVIGAGFNGAISAIELLRDGHRVTVVEPGTAGGEQAASYGNAGWLSSHSVIPPAEPGAWKTVPKLLRDPLGPLAIRWSYLPKVLPWLVRYLWSGWTPAKLERTAVALRTLLENAPALHRTLAEEAGVPELVEQKGVLHVYPSRAVFEADGLAWSLRKKVGVRWRELSGEELRQREPALNPRYTFGLHVEEAGRCLNPGKYNAALATHARRLGAEFVSARATGFDVQNGRLKAVLTENGTIPCDKAVVAAGARSHRLTGSIGDRLPLETERGYHVWLEGALIAPGTTCMASDVKMVINQMDTGLRAAGQVEIAGLEAAPNWKRAEILHKALLGMFPGAAENLRAAKYTTWIGHRPSMPDGRPCLGTARKSADIVYAFGHGHVGLVGSARTGRVVAQLVAGRTPEIPIEPFDPRRFL